MNGIRDTLNDEQFGLLEGIVEAAAQSEPDDGHPSGKHINPSDHELIRELVHRGYVNTEMYLGAEDIAEYAIPTEKGMEIYALERERRVQKEPLLSRLGRKLDKLSYSLMPFDGPGPHDVKPQYLDISNYMRSLLITIKFGGVLTSMLAATCLGWAEQITNTGEILLKITIGGGLLVYSAAVAIDYDIRK